MKYLVLYWSVGPKEIISGRYGWQVWSWYTNKREAEASHRRAMKEHRETLLLKVEHLGGQNK